MKLILEESYKAQLIRLHKQLDDAVGVYRAHGSAENYTACLSLIIKVKCIMFKIELDNQELFEEVRNDA